MWIVAIAWMYVAIMMAMAEATNPQGTILGAIITLLFYGVAPVALVMYVLSTPVLELLDFLERLAPFSSPSLILRDTAPRLRK